MKKLLILFFILGFAIVASAQYFQTGQDPSNLKWRQINTINFQLIYPDYFEIQAQKLAGTLEKVYSVGSKSLNHKPKKISVILHTQTIKSNGLVAYAPKRSEFYTTPHQEIYPQDWLEQLAIHEFRHVIQLDKINSEIPKIIKILLGEQGTALVFGAYLPWWFIEGDAVIAETALSKYGRGRLPSFLMEHKAQVVEKGIYSYDKAYNGSYKDYVPNHYKLGYHLVANSREKYGAGVWSKVLDRVGKKPFSFTPFNKALKEEIGFNKIQLYNRIFEDLQNNWITEDKNTNLNNSQIVNPTKSVYTNYKYNHWLNDSTIVSYKTSLNEIPSFVIIDKYGNEKKIFRPGTIFDESVNFKGDWLNWSEQIPNLRWSHSGESLLKIYNLVNGEKYTIKPENKALAPSISPDHKNMVVVESDFKNNYYLSLYDIITGKLIKRIQTKNNNYFFSPEWLNNKELVVIVLTNEGKRIARLDLDSKKFTFLTGSNLGEIKQLKVEGNEVYFISGYSGKDALYSLNIDNDSINQIYEPRFGVAYPAISKNNKIILSNYTVDGYQIIEFQLNKEREIPLKEVSEENYSLAKSMSSQEKGIIDFTQFDSTKYESKKYKKASNLFNFHSWAPAFVNVDSNEIEPGASIMSQNKLGTSETVLGYRWDISQKTGQFYANYIYKGWFPVLDFELSNGNRASQFMHIIETKDTITERFTWNQTKARLGIRVPLNFSKGVFNRLLQPDFQYDYTLYKHRETTPDQFFKGNFQSLSYRLYYHQLLKQSYQDVYPDLGIVLDGNFRHSPVGSENMGTLLSGQTIFYFPGIFKNHGIRIYGGAQHKEAAEKISFSDVVKYPRGWGRIATTKLYSTSFDYKFPLFYPDWNILGLVYLRRVNASIYGDYARLKGDYYKNNEYAGKYSTDISSYGIELTGDVNFLRFYAPAKIGFRTSYLPEVNNVYFDFLFSIDFTSF